MADRDPSPDVLLAIAYALRDFLGTEETYSLFLIDPDDFTGIMGRLATTEALAALERLLNPSRLAFGADGFHCSSVSHWPYPVIQAMMVLRKETYKIIQDWDLPEICTGSARTRGKFSIEVENPDGSVTTTHIDRPELPFSLSTNTKERLLWCLKVFAAVLSEPVSSTSDERSSEDGFPYLTPTESDVIQALYECKAFEEAERLTTDEIAKRSGAGGGSGENIKNMMSKLTSKDKILSSRRGSQGGYWLTPLGRSLAETRFDGNR